MLTLDSMAKKKNSPEVKKYLFTSAQASYYENKDGDHLPWGGGKNGKAAPHKKLLEGFETFAKETGAELVIAPIAGRNTREDILHEDLENRVERFDGELLRLNQNLQFRDIVVPAQNVDPTTGKATLVSKYNSSLIIPHTKQRVLPVPVFEADLPRYIHSTGAVTLPNYNLANHRGDTADRNHILGGLVVEVVDGVYYNIRHVRSLKNGKFVDLGTEFNGDKAPKQAGVDTLVLGDIHWGDHDPKTIEANYEMIEFFKPKRIILHDFFNGHSINHHEKDNLLVRAREFKRGRLSLDDELKADREELARLSKAAGSKTPIYVVASNHHAFLPTYINGLSWAKKDLWNSEVGSELLARGISLDLPEKEIDDASYLIEEGMKRHGIIPDNVQFLRLKDNLRRHGYQLASHGHKGSHGSRGGGAKAREKTGGGKSISAHSHAMELYGDTYIVGTSTKLDLPYTAGGGSAWIAANGVLYDNGTAQLLPIIGGKWKAKN